jgi:O-succinylbenzoate synthase
METPFYNYETTETAWHILERFLAPLVLGAEVDPAVAAASWRQVSGHEEAKGALECALWDLRARGAGRPLWRELGGTRHRVRAAATVGIEPSIDALLAAVEPVQAAGYGRLRLKIRSGWDVEPVRAVRAAFPDLPLVADANAGYDPGDASQLRRLDRLGLLALEQPFGRRALTETGELASSLSTPICLDESISSVADLSRALRAGACQMVNIKVGRVGGLTEAVRIHDLCRDSGVAAFVGAKYELGVGRWTNLALATLPGMTLPSDVGPSARYYLDDSVSPQLEFAAPGWVEPAQGTGIGAAPTDGAQTVRRLELHSQSVSAA